jgi:hypothetical protein
MKPHLTGCCVLIIYLLFPFLASTQPISDPQSTSPAGKIFEQVKPSLLQIRVKMKTGGSIATCGSGFFVSSDGLVVTNYHVVSDIVMEPEVFSLEYLKSDETTGPLHIVAIDVRNDLAILRLKGENLPSLSLQKKPLNKGDRGYSLGNPLDIGMSIAEGTYNGLVSTQYNDLFHFTGAINSGMSGGPSVTEEGTVFGVNEATRRDGQLVCYLVPAFHVSKLLEKALNFPPKPHAELLADVNEQLLAYQDEIATKLLAIPFVTTTLGRGYYVPDKLAVFFDCGGSKTDTKGKHYTINSSTCASNSALWINDKLYGGYVAFSHDLIHGDQMRAMNFSSLYSRYFENAGENSDSDTSLKNDVGRYACNEDLLNSNNIKMRVVLCERQYKKLDGLYDIRVIIATLNEPTAGLQSSAVFHGFSHENGMRLAKRYLESLTWKP